jgi:hypothetical protein
MIYPQTTSDVCFDTWEVVEPIRFSLVWKMELMLMEHGGISLCLCSVLSRFSWRQTILFAWFFYRKPFVFQFEELVPLPKCQAKWTLKKHYCSTSLEYVCVISNHNFWPQIHLSCTDYRATTSSQINSMSVGIMWQSEGLGTIEVTCFCCEKMYGVSEKQSSSFKTTPFRLQTCLVSCVKCTMSYAPSDYLSNSNYFFP